MLPFGAVEALDHAALKEKVYAAERRMALIRIAIIALNSATYLTVFDRGVGVRWLALAVIGVAWLYALPVALFEPYRRMKFLMAALFTAVSDAILISLWIVATGGYDSPYYLLWYAAIASVAFRYDYARTMIAAAVDSALYVAIVAAFGQLAGHPAGVILRTGYILFVGALCGEAAREAYRQIRSEMQLREDMRRVEATEARFRAAADNASDAILAVDAQGAVVYGNSHAERLFGAAAGAIVGRRVPELLSEASRLAWDDLRARALAGEATAEPVQLTARRPDGVEVSLEVSLAPWVTDEGSFLTAIARDVTERKRAEAQLEYQTLHDPLTGLPNRVLLNDRLQSAISASMRDDSHVAFLLVDLDYFKDVNDTFGHDWGDRVLEGAAERLRQAVRDSDTVARLGGDEFGIVLTKLHSAENASSVARKILRALDRPFVIDGQSAAISGSIGVVVAPEHGRDVDTLRRRADAAMYTAKGHRNGYALYQAGLDNAATERLNLASDLQQAIQYGQLALEFQPQVAFAAGRQLGVEALMRWRHPVHGLIEPDRFIPLAERAGLINDLTDWLIDGAVTQAQAWAERGRDIPVGVNVSARGLHDPQLAVRVQRALRRHDLAPRLLKLEIAERTIMAHGGRELDTLTDLHALGVVLSLRGFGGGYSSLAQLKRLPVGELKIDPTLTHNLLHDDKDVAIVRSVVDLGHNLGWSVVAEGVDVAALAERLAGLGVDHIQGYYFGMPMPADALDTWLATSPWARPDHDGLSGASWRPSLKLA